MTVLQNDCATVHNDCITRWLCCKMTVLHNDCATNEWNDCATNAGASTVIWLIIVIYFGNEDIFILRPVMP